MTSGAQSRWLLSFYWSHAGPAARVGTARGDPLDMAPITTITLAKAPSLPHGTRLFKSYRSHRKKSCNGSRLRRLSHRDAIRDYRFPWNRREEKKTLSESLLITAILICFRFRIVTKLLAYKLILFTRLKKNGLVAKFSLPLLFCQRFHNFPPHFTYKFYFCGIFKLMKISKL